MGENDPLIEAWTLLPGFFLNFALKMCTSGHSK